MREIQIFTITRHGFACSMDVKNYDEEDPVESEKDKNAVLDIKIGPRHNDSFDLFDT